MPQPCGCVDPKLALSAGMSASRPRCLVPRLCGPILCSDRVGPDREIDPAGVGPRGIVDCGRRLILCLIRLCHRITL